MYYRRKILLNFIAAFGDEGVDKLKLQILLFLFCQGQTKPCFDFVPYKYGCFSFQATKDLGLLANHYHLTSENDNQWFIQSKPPELKPQERTSVDQLARKFKEYTYAQMVDHVYKNFSYYFIRNEWNMTEKQLKLVAHQKELISKKNKTKLFTIGYEGKSIDAYLNKLIENNISLLCDVRKDALSMKYGFSKRQLQNYCKNLGIMYQHVPALGIASEQRQNLKKQEDYQLLFEKYQNTLVEREEALHQVLELLNTHKRIALTCFESNHLKCHRHRVSDYLEKNNGLEACHL